MEIEKKEVQVMKKGYVIKLTEKEMKELEDELDKTLAGMDETEVPILFKVWEIISI